MCRLCLSHTPVILMWFPNITWVPELRSSWLTTQHNFQTFLLQQLPCRDLPEAALWSTSAVLCKPLQRPLSLNMEVNPLGSNLWHMWCTWVLWEAERQLEFRLKSTNISFSHSPPCGINSNGSRLTEVAVKKCPPPAPICSGHWDSLVSRIRPVDILVNPVNRQPFRRVQLAVYQNHLLRCVAGFVYVCTAETGFVTGLAWHREGCADVHRAGAQEGLSAGSITPTQWEQSAHVARWLTKKPLQLCTASFCCFLLYLGPTSVFGWQAFPGQGTVILCSYQLPATTAQFSTTSDLGHINFSSTIYWDLWALEILLSSVLCWTELNLAYK